MEALRPSILKFLVCSLRILLCIYLHSPITKFPGGPVDEVLEKAAERLGISTTQVIFLWVKAKGAVIVT